MKKIIVIALTLILTLTFYACDSEKKAAKDSFNTAVEELTEKNEQLDQSIQTAQAAIDVGETPLEESAVSDLEEAISNANKSKIEVPEMPDETDEINAAATELSAVDYSSQIAALQEKQKSLKDSIKQFKQLSNPTESFVIERLKTAKSIDNIKAVTEDNDPNGNLNKAGGYTACIYFTSPQVNQNEVYGEDPIEKGTDGGGAVEVYKTVADAEKRNTYLAAFDGNGFLDSGSHSVVGTVIIRTSTNLTASQQKELEKQIYDALIKL